MVTTKRNITETTANGAKVAEAGWNTACAIIWMTAKIAFGELTK